jgi:hypothetical protein
LPVSLDCPFFISPRFSITFIDVKLLLIVSCDKLSFNVHEACRSPYTKHLFTPRLFFARKDQRTRHSEALRHKKEKLCNCQWVIHGSFQYNSTSRDNQKW